MEESLGLFRQWFDAQFDLQAGDVKQYSPLTLAYIGDAVYELVIRTMIVRRGNTHVDKLHHQAIKLVKAKTQADLVHALMPELTEEEQNIYKRGRNAKSFTKAKNASVTEYRTATGCEALIGWLYLRGEYTRLVTLVQHGLTLLELI